MGIPTADGDHLHTKDHPAYSRGSATKLAGDVLPFPVSSQVSTARIAGMQNLKNTIADKHPEATADQMNGAFNKMFGKGGQGAKVLTPFDRLDPANRRLPLE